MSAAYRTLTHPLTFAVRCLYRSTRMSPGDRGEVSSYAHKTLNECTVTIIVTSKHL